MTLGRLVQRLEEAGWIERRSDPSDRRARRLYTTPKVAPVLERMWALGETTREEALAGLGDEERQRLVESLLKVRGNISEREVRDLGDGAGERPRRLRHG